MAYGTAIDPATGSAVKPGVKPGQRDVRLDFFRGIAMFIIFIAHMPGNAWTLYIPARFGPSDATEMFVFCSGFASAIAFGGAFKKYGFGIGTARVLFRCWQIYWAHIALFFTILAIVSLGTFYLPGDKDYIGGLNLYHFVNDPARGIIHLMTFTYVPNLFDILPMYFGVLLLLPIIVYLARVHVGFAVAFSVGLWAAVQAFGWDFPAEWWLNKHGEMRTWYFNPLAWQVLFFTGFAFGAGWFKSPPRSAALFWSAVVFVAVTIPVEYWPIRQNSQFLKDIWDMTRWGTYKSDFGVLRYAHFLSLAYIALYLLHGREQGLHHPYLKPIIKVGQQALPTFLSGLVLSRLGGMFLDQMDRTELTWTIANLSGFALLICVAYVAGFFKNQPWRKKPTTPPQPVKAESHDQHRARYQPGAAD